MKYNNTIQTPSKYPKMAPYIDNSSWSNCCLLSEEQGNEIVVADYSECAFQEVVADANIYFWVS